MEKPQMSHNQLLKLKANPNYKLSERQRAWLDYYEAKKFKANSKFAKHSTKLEEENGQSN